MVMGDEEQQQQANPEEDFLRSLNPSAPRESPAPPNPIPPNSLRSDQKLPSVQAKERRPRRQPRPDEAATRR